MWIIGGIQLGVWGFTNTAPPIFPSLDIKEAWTLYFKKWIQELRSPHLLGMAPSWSINLYLLQTLTFWVFAFQSINTRTWTANKRRRKLRFNSAGWFLLNDLPFSKYLLVLCVRFLPSVGLIPSLCKEWASFIFPEPLLNGRHNTPHHYILKHESLKCKDILLQHQNTLSSLKKPIIISYYHPIPIPYSEFSIPPQNISHSSSDPIKALTLVC